jgi:hypothetical protein
MSKPTPQEIQDLRDEAKIKEAYDKASTSVPSAPAPAPAPKKMAKGGSASSRADGIAQRGKTRGRMV